ncbi:hypothetical protein [Roseivivax isoporae]|nr:hypothetical protein [Roseivivax isoporae]
MTFKSIVAAGVAIVTYSLPLSAEVGSDRSDELLSQLAEAEDDVAAQRVERELQLEWSKSGSAAMDLLLKRGRDAMEVNDLDAAVEHLTALTDHAPDFAEGWLALSLAYYAKELYGPAAYALERTLALNPDHFGALQGVGAIFDHLDEPQRAYDAYAMAARLRPHDQTLLDAMERLERDARGWKL